MKTFLLAVWVSVLAIPALRAQEVSSAELAPMPTGDLIHKRAPEFSQWKVTSAPSQGKGATDVALYTKTGKIIRVDRMTGQYGLFTVWCVEGMEFLDAVNGDAAEVTRSLIPGFENPYFTDLTKTDFPGCEWIDASAYLGMRDYYGTRCLVFKKPQKKEAADQELAFVSEQTRLPIALIHGREIVKFEWKEIPSQSNLSLPPKVQRLLNHRLKAIEQSAKPGISPY